jgi:hypothetical protein
MISLRFLGIIFRVLRLAVSPPTDRIFKTVGALATAVTSIVAETPETRLLATEGTPGTLTRETAA